MPELWSRQKEKVLVGGNICPMIELGAGFDLDLNARKIYILTVLLWYSKRFYWQISRNRRFLWITWLFRSACKKFLVRNDCSFGIFSCNDCRAWNIDRGRDSFSGRFEFPEKVKIKCGVWFQRYNSSLCIAFYRIY